LCRDFLGTGVFREASEIPFSAKTCASTVFLKFRTANRQRFSKFNYILPKFSLDVKAFREISIKFYKIFAKTKDAMPLSSVFSPRGARANGGKTCFRQARFYVPPRRT
jgi:hypothetical protein